MTKKEALELAAGYDGGVLDKLSSGAKQLGVELSDLQTGQLVRYYELLVEWNSFMNLTAITDFSEVCTKHFLDSLSLCVAVDCTGGLRLIDVGTGAGFPGIVLKIAFPNLDIVLLDSLGKRVKFLNTVIDELGLKNIEAVHGRAEDFARQGDFREQFDICVSRAVASLPVLSEYCLGFVRRGGCFIPYKSGKIEDELAGAKRAIGVLGGELTRRVELELPGSDIQRSLLVIEKKKSTPQKYPRKAGIPSKEPI